MKHKQEEYWRPRFHAPPLRPHPDPPPTIQCSWYPHEGQCPYMRLALVCWRSNGECTFTDMTMGIAFVGVVNGIINAHSSGNKLRGTVFPDKPDLFLSG